MPSWSSTTVGWGLDVRYGKALPVDQRLADAPYPVVGSAGPLSATCRPLTTRPVIVIGRKGNAGSVQLMGDGCWPLDTTFYAEVPDSFEPRFLYHQMVALDLGRLDSSTATPSLRREDLEAQRLLVPEYNEQLRTVDLLEDHLSRIKAGETGLSTAKTRVRALWQSAVDHETAQPHRQAGKVAWLSVQDVAEDGRSGVVIGPFGSNLKTSDYRDDGVPLVFVRNVRTQDFAGTRRFVSHEKAKELRAHLVLPGDVVITKMGDPPGDAALYDASEPGIVTADVIRLRVREGISAAYIAHAFNSRHVRRQMVLITRGVAQKKVSLARVRAEVRIPVPSLQSQLEAVERLAALQAHIDRLKEQLRMATEREHSLRRSLLNSAFFGAR